MRRKLLIIPIFLLIVIGVTACTLPGAKAPTIVGQTPDYTQAVLTLMAGQTQPASAGKLTSTPASGQPSATPEAEKQASDITPTATTGSVQPTATPSPQPTATSAAKTPIVTLALTYTRTPTAAWATADPRFLLGTPTWYESFDGKNTWYAYEDEQILMKAKDDKLEMTAFEPDYKVGWALTPWLTTGRYYLEMAVTTGPCKGLDRYGFYISPTTDAEKGLLYDFSCDGKYSLWIWDGEEATNLVYWTTNSAIKAGPDQTNRIGMKILGKRLFLYANGALLTTLDNDRYDRDYFGVFIGSSETMNFTVKVEEMSYWELP